MHFLLLALLGTAAAVPLAVEERNTDAADALRYNLPRESKPLFYDVRLFLNPDNDANFTGDVSIRLTPNYNTNQIVLHAMEMEIITIRVFSDRDVTTNLFSSYTLATDDTHMLRITTTVPLEADLIYNLYIDYVGHYAENMFGIYVSTYADPDGTPRRLITSQLQPTFARRAFPCFDEPALKAIFRTTIYAPPAYPIVRSNMPIRADNLKPDVVGWVKHEFDDTLVMSSYLIAYLVSTFGYIENTNNPIYNIPFRIYSRPGTQDTAAFALDFGQRNMIALEEYTEFPYEFPKMDKVAAPDFAAGAMENWGLVIYREVALLVREGVTTTSVRQNIGRIICHENMHMWFGNEVGPWSWTYTWLNEGFANFFENFATDLVNPDWRMMDQYVIAMQNVFQNDAVLAVNPMTHPVFSPSQIIGTFNAVAYQKSGSVIRMMQHFLTPEIFRQGLVIYIKKMTRQAAQPADLYASLQEALDNSTHSIPWPIANIMDRWTNQGGFPVVTATRDAPSGNSITMTQQRYFTDRSQTSNFLWQIPVNWALSTSPVFTDTSPQSWMPISTIAHSVDIPGLSQAEWFIVNKQQTGYYRVNYDVPNWQALARVLNSDNHQIIHLLNRAQIIDDSFNLARNGRLSYDHAMEISRYLVREQDYIPWAAANAAFGYVDIVLSSTDVYDLWQRYVLELTAPEYARLGFEVTASDEFVTAYHRTIILNLNCRLGNEQCVTNAEALLENYRVNNVRPRPDIQSTVYCSALRGGSTEHFDFLWGQYLASTDSSEQSTLLNALGCTSNNVSRAFYMNQVIADNSQVREQDRHTILVSVINASPENMDAALDFVVEYFDRIQQRVQGLSGTANIMTAFSRRLNSQAHSQKINELSQRHDSVFTERERVGIADIQENIAASITWSNNHFGTVEAWLQENYRDSANALSASIVICISVLVAFFNH